MPQPPKKSSADIACLLDHREFSCVAKQLVGRCAMIVALLISLVSTGCITSQTKALWRAAAFANLGGSENLVEVDRVGQSSVPMSIQRLWARPAVPSQRTALLLRRFNLTDVYETKPDEVIRWLHQLVENGPTLEEVHALAELAEKQASWSAAKGETERASRLYSTAIVHAYHFLFNADLNIARNAYDPQFRSICDVYNRSLEGLLREVLAHESFGQGYRVQLGSDQQSIDLEIKIEGRWRDQLFERFELVSDYKTKGFESEHRTYGLGAPLIAVRKKQMASEDREFEKHYPPELTMPLTAFLHLLPESESTIAAEGQSKPNEPRKAVLSLYDPLEQTTVKTDGKMVPLESDITTPLAYGLKDPLVNKGVLATASLLNADFAPESYGLFMLEPYDRNKIPVVMVHGLWDGPPTWAHMFNDLRANRDLHNNYQFWFYSYPTAQPFWASAKQLRDDLRKIRDEVDPQRTTDAMDQMVLVGHSMGGLVSVLQTMDSGENFWDIVSDTAIDDWQGDRDAVELVRDTFFFKANPSISRVITIATPFKGSDVANSATRWIGKRLITLPKLLTNDIETLANNNSDVLKDPLFLTTTNSVDSLSKESPAFAAFAKAQISPEVQIHNIAGRLGKKSVFGAVPSDDSASDGDGVVSVSSASAIDAMSQIYVEEEHSKLHQHPGCILEVRRVLLQQLAENDRVRARPLPTIQRIGTERSAHALPASASGPALYR
jgi:hypothetical protein